MVRITKKNYEKISAMLEATNGRATRHTYNYFEDVIGVAEYNETKLASLNIPKRIRAGAKAYSTSGGNVPNAYKWSRKVTVLSLVRRATGWFLTSVNEGKIWGSSGPDRLHLLQAQMDASTEATMREFDVSILSN